jgi:hypothetical protein
LLVAFFVAVAFGFAVALALTFDVGFGVGFFVAALAEKPERTKAPVKRRAINFPNSNRLRAGISRDPT